MKTLALALPLAAFLASAGAAYAVDVDSGTVRQLDARSGAITLMDGRSFKVSNPILLDGVIPGEKVIITVNDDKTIGFSEDPSQWESTTSYDN